MLHTMKSRLNQLKELAAKIALVAVGEALLILLFILFA